jgi:hypothetical protein
MRTRKGAAMNRKIIILSVILTIGGIGAGTGLSAAGAFSSSAPKVASTSRLLAYSVNSQGETYGSAAGATTPPQFPDLIQVQASNGVTGYVKKTDLLGPTPTLQQVLNYPRNSQGNFVAPQTSSTIPVYASDGTTQVGVFAASGN